MIEPRDFNSLYVIDIWYKINIFNIHSHYIIQQKENIIIIYIFPGLLVFYLSFVFVFIFLSAFCIIFIVNINQHKTKI